MAQWVEPHGVKPDHVQSQEPRCWNESMDLGLHLYCDVQATTNIIHK